MNYKKLTISLAAVATIFSAYSHEGCSAEAKPTAPAPVVVAEETKEVAAPAEVKDSVVAIVNNEKIMQSEVDNIINMQMMQFGGGMQLPADQMEMIRTQMMPQILPVLINNLLIEQAVKAEKIVVSNEDMKKYLTDQFENMLTSRGMTSEEYGKIIKEQTGKTIAELIEEEAAKPEQQKVLQQMKYIEKHNPSAAVYTEKEAKEFYDANQELFTKGASVKASHILIKTEQDASEEDKAKAKKQIEEIQKKIKDGGDFGALAKEFSACPSKESNGELGEFGQGEMVPEFEKAAFAMKDGEVSDIVTTSFGYHLIKRTGGSESSVIPFEEIKQEIMMREKMNKMFNAQKELAEKLRESAKIQVIAPVAPKTEEK
ncbi:MAG: peptidylprolyl isomerase [Lentisphaeria bacterium]